MAKSDRSTRQRPCPLLYPISFLKPQLWVSLAECCNFFHNHSCNQTVTLLHVERGPPGACRHPQSGTHQTQAPHPSAPPLNPPNTVRDIERYLGAPGYGRPYRGYGDRNLYSKWTQPSLCRDVFQCAFL